MKRKFLAFLLILICFVISGCGEFEIKCAKEGESIPVIQNPPECCEGLTLILPKDPNLVGSAGFCTANCGDGFCDESIESEYNCPDDCFDIANDSVGPIQYGECGDDVCDYGENTSSYPYYCPQDC